MENVTDSVAELVLALAAKHGITASPDRIDNLANTFSELSVDDVKLDEIEILLAHLARKKIISKDELFRLSEQYFG